MQLDELVKKTGAWLQGSGPHCDIVISTRLRLARNLADFPFTDRANEIEKREIESRTADAIKRLESETDLNYFPLAKLTRIDKLFLVERQLISRELAAGTGCRGVAIGPNESCSLMVNEEDHLRIQVMKSGLSLMDCWAQIDRVDDLIKEKLPYAFHHDFGYLTACPTNVGTGIRASVMLHLPALTITRQIERAFRALQKIQLTVRGLHGEGSQASGDFYQVSNSITLGRSELDLIKRLEDVIPQIILYERTARQELLTESRQTLHDRVSRAFGVLRTAQTISSEETMQLLSSVRMGIALELIDDISLQTLNELFVQIQPAHLQKLENEELESEQRNIIRAKLLRSRLGS